MTTTFYTDLGNPDETAFKEAEAAAPEYEDIDLFDFDEEDELPSLSEEDAQFLDQLVLKTIMFCEALSDLTLRPYQRDFAYRFVESVILADGDTITGLLSRQSGKSELVSTIIAGIVVLFPKLALTYKILERFKHGVWVGAFAPVDGQSDFIFGRIKEKLTSDHGKAFLADDEIDEKVKDGAVIIKLRSGSFVRKQTANPRAKIEGGTYHIIVLDEAQDADDTVINKSMMPMLAANSGTCVMIGTPSYTKGQFYKTIQYNKRVATGRGKKQNHYQYDYKVVSKYNPLYGRFVKKEKLKLGEDSDEFQMSYAIKWLLDRGMLTTEDELDDMADNTMTLVRAWNATACVAGIDVARVKDSTVVTVCWVDWNNPDPEGFCEIRVLNWLEISNTQYEEQYYEIFDFLAPYNVIRIGVDGQGMGGPVGERLERMFAGRAEVVVLDSGSKAQSIRWKHLIKLMQRHMLGYPGHSKARRTRVWKRFRQQMEDAEKTMKNQYLMVSAPDDAKSANDDYVDSLALATAMTIEMMVPEVEVMNSPFYERRR